MSAKRSDSRSPSQKLGIETPISERTIDVLSRAEYCFRAEIIPTGIPMMRATKIPATARTAVFGNLSRTCAATLIPFLYDSPKSP